MSAPTITRQNVIRGPGTVTLGSGEAAVQLFDRDGISADVALESFDVPVSAYGNVDTRRKDATAKIVFRPCGELTAAILAKLIPHGDPDIGGSLLGSSDTPCIVHSLAGQKVTFHAAALTRMPGLKLSTLDTAFSGQAEVTACVKNATARTAENSLYTVAAEAWSGGFDVANLKGGVYVGTWNGVTFTSADGWDIEFDLGIEPQYADGVGTYDLMLTAVGVTARCKPLGLSESTLLGYLNAQGASAALGSSMLSGADLVIACDDALTVTLKSVAVMRGPLKWGNTDLRADEIAFRAHRDVAGGTPGEIFSAALTA